jgi:hypothetical protein
VKEIFRRSKIQIFINILKIPRSGDIMAIAGFGFTDIEVKRKPMQGGKISISNNVAIKDIKETELHLGKEKQNALQFLFEFTSKYDPDVGHITIGGEVLFIDEAKKVQEILANWKKDKRVPQEVMTNILNNILNKCNIAALIMSREVNLPAPIPLPKVQVGKPAKK